MNNDGHGHHALGSAEVAITDPQLGLQRAGWDEYREAAMVKLRDDIKSLIDMHDRYGDSLQKSYLWKALHRLSDGLEWFKWSRQRNARSQSQRTGAAND